MTDKMIEAQATDLAGYEVRLQKTIGDLAELEAEAEALLEAEGILDNLNKAREAKKELTKERDIAKAMLGETARLVFEETGEKNLRVGVEVKEVNTLILAEEQYPDAIEWAIEKGFSTLLKLDLTSYKKLLETGVAKDAVGEVRKLPKAYIGVQKIVDHLKEVTE